ncbi:tetratricopeptide repeat protein [Amycolatopsis thailandensis]|uniref:tetratricopeptide repeat protein n=1 Tax=Amycolatopsis thailandensis TaxID=589330 RepID=UPI0037B383C7
MANAGLVYADSVAWRMHDLLRIYAEDLLDQRESTEDRQAASVRLLDHFCDHSEAIAKRFTASPLLTAFRTLRSRALATFDREAETLTEALESAQHAGKHQHVLRLANSLGQFIVVRPVSLDWQAIFTHAVNSARVLKAPESIRHFRWRLGDTCVRLKQFERATAHFRAVIRTDDDAQRDAASAAAWNGLANVHLDCGDLALAVRCGQQALAIFRELGDRRNEAAILGNLANACRGLRWFDAAFALYHDSLALARSLGDKQSEGLGLTNLARAHRMKGDLATAVGYLETALSLRTGTGDTNGAAKVCSEIANVYEELEGPTEAIRYRERALLTFRESRDRHGEASELWSLGSLYSGLGRSADAVRCLRASLDLDVWRDQRRHADLVNTLAVEYCRLREFPLAINCFSTALNIYIGYDDRRSMKMVLANLSRAYFGMGVAPAAIHYGRQWLDMAEADDHEEAVEMLVSLATFCWRSDSPAAALDYCAEAYRLCGKEGSPPASLRSITGFAQVAAGHFTDGIRTLSACLELHDAPAEKAVVLTALGMAHREIGEHGKSISSHRSAIALFQAIGDHAEEANAMGNLGNAYADNGQAQEAQEHLRTALEFWRQLGDRGGEGLTLNNLAMIRLDEGDQKGARELWEAAVAVLEDHGDLRLLQTVRTNLTAMPGDSEVPQSASVKDNTSGERTAASNRA